MRRDVIRLMLNHNWENQMKASEILNDSEHIKANNFFSLIGNIFMKPINVSSCTKVVYIMLRKFQRHFMSMRCDGPSYLLTPKK